jgi:hypothetical protein
MSSPDGIPSQESALLRRLCFIIFVLRLVSTALCRAFHAFNVIKCHTINALPEEKELVIYLITAVAAGFLPLTKTK